MLVPKSLGVFFANYFPLLAGSQYNATRGEILLMRDHQEEQKVLGAISILLIFEKYSLVVD
jgi:hypothetical protein